MSAFRTRAIATLLTLGVLTQLAACGSSRDGGGPVAIDPSGQYRFSYDQEGTSVTGRASILGEPGSYTGTVRLDDGRPDLPISTVATSGELMVVTADVPGAVLLLRLRFAGDDFSGDWSLGHSGGPIEGSRIHE